MSMGKLWQCFNIVYNIEKGKYKLLKFDIINFYSRISETFLRKAINFGKLYENIEDQKIRIKMNAEKSVLYKQGKVWIKANSNYNSKLFDVTMEERHGAEITFYKVSKMVILTRLLDFFLLLALY